MSDFSKHINLTNLIVVVCLVRFAVAKTMSFPEAAIMIAAIALFASKTTERKLVEEHEESIKNFRSRFEAVENRFQKHLEEIVRINGRIPNLDDRTRALEEKFEPIAKTHDEVKQILTASRLSGLNRKPHQL